LDETPELLTHCLATGIGALDMECAYVLARAREFHEVSAVLQVSDRPLDAPFWKVGLKPEEIASAAHTALRWGMEPVLAFRPTRDPSSSPLRGAAS
jgi:hypothetical protein